MKVDRWQEILWLHPYRVTLLHRLMPCDVRGARELLSYGTVERYLDTDTQGVHRYKNLSETRHHDVRQAVPEPAQLTDGACEAMRTVARGQILAVLRAQYTDMG